jgi:ABC-2 type transport system permease protein
MISLRKIGAICAKQLKVMAYNLFILVGFLAAPIMAFFMRGDGPDGFVLSFLILINVLFAGANTMCVLIAEEKEKHTLNVLITSTVSGFDFLISNLIITVGITVAINGIIFFILGFQGVLPFVPFLLLTGVGVMPAALIGAIIGIVTKNQMTATTAIVPVMVLLIYIPAFMQGSFFVENIIYYGFAEQMVSGLTSVYLGESIAVNLGVIALNLFVLMVVFGLCYRKKGLVN